jgi:hypothetical protein
MIFSSGNQHDRQNALLYANISQNEISLARREPGRKPLISWVIATLRPAEPRKHCDIFSSAMMSQGALTDRFSSFLRNRPDKAPQPRTYTVTHSTGVSETTLHCAVVRSLHSRPAPFRFDFRNSRSVRVARKEDDGGSTAAARVILVGWPLFLTNVLSPGTKCCMG